MTKQTSTKSSHFIPRFYQKYWEISELKGRLYVLQKNEYSKVRYKGIKSNCCEDYLYAIDIKNPDNIFEHHYRDFENKIAPQYARMVNQILNLKCLQKVSEDDKRLICKIFAHLSARNPQNVYSADSLFATLPFTLGYEDRKLDIRALQNVYAFGQSGAVDGIMSKFEQDLNERSITILVSDKPNIFFVDNIIKCTEFTHFPLSPYIIVKFHEDVNSDRFIQRIADNEYESYLKEYVESMEVHKMFASNRDVLQSIKDRYVFYYL